MSDTSGGSGEQAPGRPPDPEAPEVTPRRGPTTDQTSSPEEAAAAGGSTEGPPAQGDGQADSY